MMLPRREDLPSCFVPNIRDAHSSRVNGGCWGLGVEGATYMFELLFCFISPSFEPFAGGDVGLLDPLKRLLGGEGTIFGRFCGGIEVLPDWAKASRCCPGDSDVSCSELSELALELPPTLKDGLLWLCWPSALLPEEDRPSGLVLRALDALASGFSLKASLVLFERLISPPKSVFSPLNDEYGVLTRLPSEYGASASSSAMWVRDLNGLKGSTYGLCGVNFGEAG